MERGSALTQVARLLSSVRGDFTHKGLGSPAEFDQSVLRRALTLLVVAKIAGLILVFDPTQSVGFDLSKAIYSRLTLWLIAGVLVLAALTYGFAVFPRTRLHLLVGGFLAAVLLSALLAEDRYSALFGEPGRYLGAFFVVDMTMLYLAVSIAFRRFEDWTLLGAGVAAATLVVLLYAGLQYVGAGSDVARLIVSSTFATPDAYGRFLSLTFGSAVGVAALGGGQVGPRVRVVAGLIAAAAFLATTLAIVRGTVIAIAAVSLLVPVLYLRMRGTTGTRLAIASGGSFAGAILFLCVVAITPIGGSLARSIGDESIQTSRQLLFDSTIRAVVDRPLLGHGPDSFGFISERYASTTSLRGAVASDARNWLLNTLATTGIIGALFYGSAGLVSAAWIWAHLRRRVSALAPALFLALVAYWIHASITVGSIAIDWFPYLLFGAIATAGKRSVRVPAPSRVTAQTVQVTS